MTLHVLVVDDDMDIRLLATLMLRKLGCTVDVATDGASAVDMVQAITPDIVFLDILMPIMGGEEALRLMRANGYSGQVIIMTALDPAMYEAKLIAAGADGFTRKPLLKKNLQPYLEKLGQR